MAIRPSARVSIRPVWTLGARRFRIWRRGGIALSESAHLSAPAPGAREVRASRQFQEFQQTDDWVPAVARDPGKRPGHQRGHLLVATATDHATRVSSRERAGLWRHHGPIDSGDAGFLGAENRS